MTLKEGTVKKAIAICLVFLAIVAATGFAQQKQLGPLLVFNNWSSDSEIGALNVIRNAFQAQGGRGTTSPSPTTPAPTFP